MYEDDRDFLYRNKNFPKLFKYFSLIHILNNYFFVPLSTNSSNDIHVAPSMIQMELCHPYRACIVGDFFLRRVSPYANLYRPFGACI